MLRVRLIGGLELELDGAPLAAPRSRRGRALLAWLALHPGAHPRAGLAARFWPDVLDESARASLRAALTELRSALGPAADHLVATRETVALDGEGTWVDERAFADLLAAGRTADAAELGAGELLPGLEDEWALDARQQHAHRLAEALEALAAEAERAGDLAEAVRRTRAAVALDPLAEDANRRLIERLRRAGDDASALAAYDRLAARLRTQLGVAPSPPTRALAREIRDGAAATGAATAVPPPAALRRAGESPFVGRARELERLRAAWTGARLHAARRLVLLAGEPGIGKTRLAMRLAAEADEHGAVVLAGRCWEEPLGAYGPFAEALRQCADALGLDALQALAGPTGGELTRLLGGAVAASDATGEAGARHRLFDAVDAALSGLTRERPLLLVLDDLHWADRPTLLMLAFLLASPRRAAMLVLGTYRDTELGRHSPLTRALADLPHDGTVDRLRLGGLDAGDVAALARAWLGEETGGELAATVHARTGGNAFFTEEVLRGVAHDGQDSAPESVRQAVGARLARLSEAATGLLSLGALLGGAPDSDVLAAVSELPADEAEAALDELLRAGLLRPSPGAPRALEFSHALVREVVDAETNALRRSRLHRRIADELIARGAEGHLEEIARHLFESAADAERTADFLARAGRRSVALLAYEAAAGWFEKALQVVGPRGDLLVERGDALLRAGEPDAAQECFRAAAALAREARDPTLLARAALGHAGLGSTIIAVDAATVALLEEALAALGDGGDESSAGALGVESSAGALGDESSVGALGVESSAGALGDESSAAPPGDRLALRSRLLARLALELYYAPRRDRSEALGAHAVAVARTAGDPRAVASALEARHVALWRADRLGERLQVADEMVAAARAAGDARLELQARNWRAADLFEAGDLAGWREEAARHARLAEAVRLPSYAWYGPLWEAVDALHQGRFADAEPLREAARSLGARAGDGNAELFAEMLVVQEHFLRGTFERLDIGWVEDKIESSPAGPAYVAGYAWGLAALGRADDARAQLARLAAGDFALLPFDANWLSAMGEAAEAAVILRDPTHAAALYERLAPYAGRPLTAGRAVVSYGAADRHLAGLAALLGRPDDATAHFEAALELNAAMGLTPWLDRTREAYAEHLAAGRA